MSREKGYKPATCSLVAEKPPEDGSFAANNFTKSRVCIRFQPYFCASKNVPLKMKAKSEEEFKGFGMPEETLLYRL